MTHIKRIFLAAFLVASAFAAQAQAAAINLITPGAEFEGVDNTLGFKFTVKSNTTLTALGVYDAGQDGISERAQVGLFDEGGNLLISASIPAGTAAELDGYFRYQEVAGFNLIANVNYLIGAYLVDSATSFDTGSGGTATVDANVVILEDRYNFDITNTLTAPIDSTGTTGAWLGANFRAELPDTGEVPEPGSIALLGLGLAGLLTARRRAAQR